MNRDVKRVIILSAIICVLLLGSLFIPVEQSGILGACLLVPMALVVFFTVKKRRIPSLNKYQVLLIVGVCGMLYIMLYYLLGLHFGMGRRSQSMSWGSFLNGVLPIILSIIASEIIRVVFLAQKSRFAAATSFVICLATDLLLAGGFQSVAGFNDFMDLVGLAGLSAVTGNILYHYLAKRYGALPGMLLRLMLALYTVIIPSVPLVPDALKAMGGLLFPLLVYLFVNMLYEKKRVTHRKTGVLSYIFGGVVVILMISIVMMISCQFKYGILVVGSGSMTGELNVGDAAVFEQYRGQVIQEGDVIVFRSGSTRVIHRVVDINNVGGELRYVTKGDANEDPDIGYRTTSDIVGLVDYKVAYIGYPSIWIRNLFKNNS
ncbi:MAG: signal peptidase I [Ruminococcaceae bacterium]|nr:signal peptidase I [Oscillospiraceae bacterium]